MTYLTARSIGNKLHGRRISGIREQIQSRDPFSKCSGLARDDLFQLRRKTVWSGKLRDKKMKTFIFTLFLAATATDKSFAKALKNALADRIFDRLIGYVNSRKFRRKIGRIWVMVNGVISKIYQLTNRFRSSWLIFQSKCKNQIKLSEEWRS